MISKIQEIKEKTPVQTSYGEKIRFVLIMENWDRWSILSASESDFVVGQELDYEIKEKSWFKNIILNKKKGWFAPRNPKVDFIIGAMNCTAQLLASGKIESDKLDQTFETFYSLMTKKYGE